MNYSLWKK